MDAQAPAKNPRKLVQDPITGQFSRAALAGADAAPAASKLELQAESVNLSFYYGSFLALKNINMKVHKHKITALIGPSGCGKSTFLRCFNRMHDLYKGCRYEGELLLFPDKVNLINADPIEMRMRVTMVFQKPNPFPKTIYENVAFGLRVRGVTDQNYIQERVEFSLKGAALWEEVKDRLHSSSALSGGQQQRLCIARALAPEPDIILFDEPTSALDPMSTLKVEELMDSLRDKVTMVIVTHNMQQAARVADYTAFMYLGELIEFGETAQIFTAPAKEMTQKYITGHFG